MPAFDSCTVVPSRQRVHHKHAVRVHRVNHTRHHLGALHTGIAHHPGGNGRHIRQWSQRPAQFSGNVTGGQHIAVGLRPQRIRSDGGVSHPGNQYPGGVIRQQPPQQIGDPLQPPIKQLGLLRHGRHPVGDILAHRFSQGFFASGVQHFHHGNAILFPHFYAGQHSFLLIFIAFQCQICAIFHIFHLIFIVFQ